MATDILTITDNNDDFNVKVEKSDFMPPNNDHSFVVKNLRDKNCLRLGQMILDSAFIVMDDDGDNPVSKVKVTITYEQITDNRIKKMLKKLLKKLVFPKEISIFAT